MSSHTKVGITLPSAKELADKLIAKPDLFGRTPARKLAGEIHADMDDIWVRYGSDPERQFMDEHDSVWYPIIKEIPEAAGLSLAILSALQGERLGGILITRLPPGGKILPHQDSGWHAEYYDKFYLALTAEAGQVFGFDDGKIEPTEVGEVWWFDNSKTHWVENNSNSDRLAMIVCIRPAIRGILDAACSSRDSASLH